MTVIQKLEKQKRLIHQKAFKKRYPNGCFSLQIRYGQYGYESKNSPIRQVELRWGIKTNSTQYWAKSFRIKENGEINTINNSFGYVYNYDSYNELINKCRKENISESIINKYTEECKNRGIIK